MSSRPPGPWGLAIVYGVSDQREWSLDFWWQPDAAPAVPGWDGHAAAGVFAAQIQTAIGSILTTHTTIIGTELLVNDGTGTVGFIDKGSTVGSVTAQALPEDVAVIVQKNTASFLPGAQGRWYLPSFPVTHVQGSYLDGTGQGLVDAAFNTIIAPIVDQGITWKASHFHKSNNDLLHIIAINTVLLLGTRRRRRFKF